MALALQADPAIGQERARELLRATARPMTATHPGIPAENVVGAGLVDARAVLVRVVAERPAVVYRPEAKAPRPALAATGIDALALGLLGFAAVAGGAWLWSGSRRRRRV